MAEAKIPLNCRDRKVLDQMFKEIEEISQIEAVIPLEPWEEKDWMVNSSFGLRKSTKKEKLAC